MTPLLLHRQTTQKSLLKKGPGAAGDVHHITKKTQQESDTPKPQEKQKKEGDETVHEDKVTSQNRENSSSGLVSVDPHAFQDISSKHEDPASAQDNNQSSETSPANEVKKPKRRGWWQRKKLFGS